VEWDSNHVHDDVHDVHLMFAGGKGGMAESPRTLT